MNSAITGLWDLVLDVRCMQCGRSGTPWCFHCLESVSEPQLWTNGHVPVAAATSYRGVVAEAINAHKERGQLTLARPLGLLLSAACLRVGHAPELILVPCPSSQRAVSVRGQDHGRRLAQSAAAWLKRVAGKDASPPQVCTPLRARRGIRDQVGLSPRERAENLHEAFLCKGAAAPSPVIIVDDITTSGATLAEAARALQSAGWSVAGAAVIARAHAGLGVAPRAARG